jgi:hypothetical protein
VGARGVSGHGGEHLHFGIFKGEAPLDENGNYCWAFGGYGLIEEDLAQLNLRDMAARLDKYRTLKSIGGNAIDPVAFLNEHMSVPERLPTLLQTFKINKTADPKKSGEILFTKSFSRPSNGRYILSIVGVAKSGKQNYSNKWRGDDDDGWWNINGVDPRTFIDRLAHQGAYGFNGAESKGYKKDLWILIDTKADGRLSALNKPEQVLTMYADESLHIDKVEVYEWKDTDKVVLPFYEQTPLADLDATGLPLKNIITAGRTPKKVSVTGRCMSAMCKLESDDDGIKVRKNHIVVPNTLYPCSRRYGGYVFSGNQDQGGVKTIELTGFSKKPWNVLELLVDNTPYLEKVVIEF